VPNYISTTEYGATASFNIHGARAIAAHGHLNYGRWLYSVDLDGAPVKPPAADAFNSSTFWLILDSIMFLANGLETNTDHTITLTNLAAVPEWYSLTLTSFEVWHVAGTDVQLRCVIACCQSAALWLSLGCHSTTSIASPSATNETNQNSSPPTPGIIAGITTAIFIALVILGALILFFLRQRRARPIRILDPYPLQEAPRREHLNLEQKSGSVM